MSMKRKAHKLEYPENSPLEGGHSGTSVVIATIIHASKS